MSYTATVTADFLFGKRLSQGLGVLMGSCVLSVYDTAYLEIVGITGKFRTTPRVMCESISSNGYIVRWSSSDKAFKAFYPGVAGAHTHDILVIGSGTLTGTLGTDATPKLTKTAATNQTIAGANSATAGGVVSATPAPQPASEVPIGTNVGTIGFIAIGMMP